MRMSSGAASAQYENPRTGRSSCGLLTPRSNKIATIPSFPTMSTTLLEAALHDADPVPEGFERRARRCHGGGIPVDAEEFEVGPGASGAPGRGHRHPTVASTTSPVGTAASSSSHLRRHHRLVDGTSSTSSSSRLPLPGLAASSSPRDRHQPPGRVDESEAGGRGACAAPPGGLVAGPQAHLVNVLLAVARRGAASDPEVGQVVGFGRAPAAPTRSSSSQRSRSQISIRE